MPVSLAKTLLFFIYGILQINLINMQGQDNPPDFML